MVHYDHAMVGATLALAAGVERRYGWTPALLAALIAMFPDWDALPKHISPEAYLAGHRVWGHNLFAVTVAGAVLGGLAYLVHHSGAARFRGAAVAPPPLALWVVLGVVIIWSHPLLDLLYCGLHHDADWPVKLLWPVAPAGFSLPWMPWSDWGATIILFAGLLVAFLSREYRQSAACASLALLVSYIGVRGWWLHWG